MLKKINLSDQVYDELVRNIISGKYPAGEMLQEEKISTEFGISRTPIREAFRRLAAEGLIEQLPRKGFRVAMPDDAALSELFECRCGLELQALKSSIEKIPMELIVELKEKLESLKKKRDFRRAVLEADRKMHDLISAYCGNRYLIALIQQFQTKTAPYRSYRNLELGGKEELIDERISILNALEKQDRKKASALLSAHILKGKR